MEVVDRFARDESETLGTCDSYKSYTSSTVLFAMK